MPNAWASRATFLPIVPRPMMPSTLSRTWWTVGGELPCQRPAVTLVCWVISRRDTDSISSRACSDTATELAPPLLHIGTLALIAAAMSARS